MSVERAGKPAEPSKAVSDRDWRNLRIAVEEKFPVEAEKIRGKEA